MIEARIAGRGGVLAARLARKAGALARAHAASRLLARRGDPGRWRSARLLWPLFTKDSD
jgi:hypothetical protein